MAIRTTEEAVGKIIELDAAIDLTPFMESANNLVDQVCLDSDYSDATLELIERWLSAHFYAIRDPRAIQESVKGISQQFSDPTKPGLSSTLWGQTAMALDTAGNLAAVDDGLKKFRATIMHVGKSGSIASIGVTDCDSGDGSDL